MEEKEEKSVYSFTEEIIEKLSLVIKGKYIVTNVLPFEISICTSIKKASDDSFNASEIELYAVELLNLKKALKSLTLNVNDFEISQGVNIVNDCSVQEFYPTHFVISGLVHPEWLLDFLKEHKNKEKFVTEIVQDREDQKLSVKKITFVSRSNIYSTEEDFDFYFINDDLSNKVSKITIAIKRLLNYKLGKSPLKGQDYKLNSDIKSAIYQNGKYRQTKIIDKVKKDKYELNENFNIILLKKIEYNNLLKRSVSNTK